MKCQLYRSLLSSYIDGDINDIDKRELESHLAQCKDCMEEYQILMAVVKNCNDMEEVELPLDFHDKLHEKLRGSLNKKFYSRLPRVNWKWASGIAAIFVIAIVGIIQLPNLLNKSMAINEEGLYSRSGGGPVVEAPDMAPTMEMENYSVAQYSDEGSSDDGIAFRKNKSIDEDLSEVKEFGRKIIVSGSISLEVIDFDGSMKFITDLTKKYDGYIENSYIDNNSFYYAEGKNRKVKTGNAAIRIPYDKFENVLDEIKTIGEVLSENTNSSDISDIYYDTATRVDNLKIQENRLREILSKASSVEDILKIENEINRVRSEIDMMSTDIRHWDKQVSMSYLYVDLKEVKDNELSGIDVTTTWGKAYKGFIKAINSIIRGSETLFIFLVAASPYIIILIAIGFLIYYIVNRLKKRGKGR